MQVVQDTLQSSQQSLRLSETAGEALKLELTQTQELLAGVRAELQARRAAGPAGPRLPRVLVPSCHSRFFPSSRYSSTRSSALRPQLRGVLPRGCQPHLHTRAMMGVWAKHARSCPRRCCRPRAQRPRRRCSRQGRCRGVRRQQSGRLSLCAGGLGSRSSAWRRGRRWRRSMRRRRAPLESRLRPSATARNRAARDWGSWLQGAADARSVLFFVFVCVLFSGALAPARELCQLGLTVSVADGSQPQRLG